MAINTQIQAACLLVLLLASLTSSSIVQPQTGQLADLQPHDTAEAKVSFTPTLHRLRRRDTHFPICVFCCGCCKNARCGICCKT
ncbi:Hepcidin [Heterocephalus glaber]|uniref:Hepcidin n=1 Tax=Heterocephalus glaber TaxID=10181 RepID=G5BXJ4_HETGA|nr:hepcidin [Heterocephalus glaber]AIZ09002.1 hepcidin preproprotein [Heterocephalus glaber]EHB14005.1 Hepcidin [Heterocephalus glaber]